MQALLYLGLYTSPRAAASIVCYRWLAGSHGGIAFRQKPASTPHLSFSLLTQAWSCRRGSLAKWCWSTCGARRWTWGAVLFLSTEAALRRWQGHAGQPLIDLPCWGARAGCSCEMTAHSRGRSSGALRSSPERTSLAAGSWPSGRSASRLWRKKHTEWEKNCFA